VRLIHKFSLALGIFSLVAAAGCGSGGSLVLPNPTGNYSVADLNGSYVYQIHGTSFNLGPYREIGVFTTDHAGNITGGSDDFAAGGVISNNITGSYTVANDVTAEGAGFDVDTNIVMLFSRDGRDLPLPRLSKAEVGQRILDEALRLRGVLRSKPASHRAGD
jgi:hypothetical protein